MLLKVKDSTESLQNPRSKYKKEEKIKISVINILHFVPINKKLQV